MKAAYRFFREGYFDRVDTQCIESASERLAAYQRYVEPAKGERFFVEVELGQGDIVQRGKHPPVIRQRNPQPMAKHEPNQRGMSDDHHSAAQMSRCKIVKRIGGAIDQVVGVFAAGQVMANRIDLKRGPRLGKFLCHVARRESFALTEIEFRKPRLDVYCEAKSAGRGGGGIQGTFERRNADRIDPLLGRPFGKAMGLLVSVGR